MKPKSKFKQTDIGIIPEDWIFDEIENHAKIIMGQSPESKYYNLNNEGTLFLQGIRTFGSLYPNYDTWTTKVTKLARKDSVLLSVRAPVGEVNLANQDICIGRGLMSIDGENNKFIFYLFKGFKEYVVNKETGTVYGSVTRDDIAKLKFPFPKLEEQSAIAEILSSFDEKIELNNKMNKTLEAIGQAIFKHWFVNFEFPNEEGKPYKSSGGKMVESELGEIPEGWSVGNYGDLLEFERGIEPGSKNYLDKKDENTILFYRVGDLLSEDSNTYVNKEVIKNKTMNFNDVMVSFDGTVGRVRMCIEGSYSTGIRKVYSDDNSFSEGFIYFLMNSKFIQNKITEFAKGTTILHAGESIKHFITAVPNENIRKTFDAIGERIFNKLLNNKLEIRNLQKTRDLLLPKLMTGKIRVPVEVRT